MISIISTVLPIGLGVGVGYLVLRLATRRNEQMKQQFTILADNLGCQVNLPEKMFLNIDKGFPSVDGMLDGKSLHVYMYTVGSGKNQRTYTAFKIKTTNRYSYTLKIYREGFFSKLGKGLGMQDIEIGDPEFDKEFIIKANDDFFVKEIFDDPLKSHFLQVADKMKGELKLKGDEISYSEMVFLVTRNKRSNFEQVIYLGSALSDAITRFSESTKPPGI
ncbi:MAG: DUF3137 domain-containing protein [Bacteroidota bacterium]